MKPMMMMMTTTTKGWVVACVCVFVCVCHNQFQIKEFMLQLFFVI